MGFDMNRTWSQALAMVGANRQTLALLAGIFFLLPNLVLVVAMPDVMGLLIAPGAEGDPERMMAELSAQIGSLVVVMVVAALFSMIGYAAMIALLGPGRPTVGEALGAAMRALPSLIGCVLVSFVGYIALAFVGGLLIVALTLVLGEVAGAFIGVVLVLVALVIIALRFILVIPAVILEGIGNPVRAFGRSWKLTASSSWRIVGFFALLFIAYMVLSMLLFSIVGLTGNLFVIGLVNGLAGALVAMVLTAIIVSLHQQLAGNGAAAAEVFE